MRGFGCIIDLKTGLLRRWYIDENNVKRWADTNEIVREK